MNPRHARQRPTHIRQYVRVPQIILRQRLRMPPNLPRHRRPADLKQILKFGFDKRPNLTLLARNNLSIRHPAGKTSQRHRIFRRPPRKQRRIPNRPERMQPSLARNQNAEPVQCVPNLLPLVTSGNHCHRRITHAQHSPSPARLRNPRQSYVPAI